MDTIPLKPERIAQVEEYAKRNSQAAAEALDEIIANFLEAEQLDHQEAGEGIRKGYEDLQAGRLSSVGDVFERLRVKHGLSS